ncbi:hypothetical protein [Epilithonimonas hungarica]|uniref:Uncharacterized protein n=1 Tax=Epilithonimonas hungarica TaxID=454006 RepID=A0A1G7H0T0_9FLAO|nr:hypothetical protein [Epilithonimonas hungarica]SDE93955.1 hypothetical protein SAMN05421825_0644 [Epilithonimonas hungarica]
MKNFNYLLFAKRIFVTSLSFGLIALFGYIITKHIGFAIFGYFYLIFAGIINTLILLFFLITAVLHKEKRIECFQSILILGINIPLSIFCAIIGDSLL